MTAIVTIFAVSFFLVLALVHTKEAQARRVEQARRKTTDKARSYQRLMDSLPDVIWTRDIYEATFNF